MSKRKKQITLFAALSGVVIAFTLVLYISSPDSFNRYFGKINPLFIIPGLSVLGAAALICILARYGFEVLGGTHSKRSYPFYLLAVLLAAVAVVIDIFFTYPEDTHIRYPHSVLFYPVMGYVVEILFHLLPLSLLLVFSKAVFRKSDTEKHVLPVILIVSLIEPTFQTALSPDHFPLWITIYVWIHLFAFNFLQLSIFKRYGFMSMFLFRLVYYVLWHMVWGAVRLGLLFSVPASQWA